MRWSSPLLVLLLAIPLQAASPVRGGLPALPTLPGSAVASIAAVTTLSPAAGLTAPPAAITLAPTAAPSVRPAAGTQDLSRRLSSFFLRLDAQYVLPKASATELIRMRVRAQLLFAARDYAEPEPDLLETVALETDKALVKIQARLDAGEIDPAARIRLADSDPERSAVLRTARVGVYPVAADPFQWGHLLIALRAVGELGVDKVVFVLAGDDPRKPAMTPVEHRHPMGRDVLGIFSPFFEYSPIAVGTTFDGETNIFRLLALNPRQGIEAWYMVGDDHYRWVDKNGNPDTLPKLERNYRQPLGHNPTLHALKVAFIRREAPAEAVPTDLEVRFLDHVGFEASSTQVRAGRHTLMPHAVYDYSRRKALGLYGIPPAPVKE